MLAKIMRFLGMIVIGIIIIISILLILPFDKYVIQSGSMEPTLPVGSIIYVSNEKPENIKTGDIITFYANRESTVPTTHRVIEIDATKRQFITKGDANEKEDIIPVSWLFYIGKVAFHIPMIGFVLASLTTINGKIFLISGLLVGIVLIELAVLMEKKKNK